VPIATARLPAPRSGLSMTWMTRRRRLRAALCSARPRCSTIGLRRSRRLWSSPPSTPLARWPSRRLPQARTAPTRHGKRPVDPAAYVPAPSSGILMGGRSPPEFVGKTPSPSYYAATHANSPLMPAYTAGPYTTGAFPSDPIPATAFSVGAFSSAGYATTAMASAALSGSQYPATLPYTSASYPPYPALSLAVDGTITDSHLSATIPSTPMTALPMFSEDGTEHAWSNAAHPNVLVSRKESTAS